MSEISIVASDLGKRYTLAKGQSTFREALNNIVTWPVGVLRRKNGNHDLPSSREFWALKNVSFEVQQGEVFGIIGRNGSGKSTLLRILSRIARPTTGYAEVWGHVGSLLEVGTGFHPELTGRENVFLSGSILGMSRATVNRRFDDIVSFSGVEKFIDTPVKHFSSGMYVRLAFSVASHLDADILLLDEVLSVGDMEFQQKSRQKMLDLTKSGRTVLIVSHSMESVGNLCQRALWLDKGRVAAIGETATVITAYREAVNHPSEAVST